MSKCNDLIYTHVSSGDRGTGDEWLREITVEEYHLQSDEMQESPEQYFARMIDEKVLILTEEIK